SRASEGVSEHPPIPPRRPRPRAEHRPLVSGQPRAYRHPGEPIVPRQPRLVLASASPRRRELLARLGVPFDVVPSPVEESLASDEPASVLALALARAKARDVATRVGDAAVVVGADTLVVLDGRPFGKPPSPADARWMLAALAGRAHEVVTAVAVVETGSGREA